LAAAGGGGRTAQGQKGRFAQTRLPGAGSSIRQALISKQALVRVVREGGKCYRETMSPVRGSVDKREEVPCETKCKGGAG
jgi:hypothetical protein